MILRVEGGLTYSQTFDIENRFISVTVNGQTTQFVYDGDGNLVKKINPDGSRTLYIGGIYEIDKSPSGSVTRTVTYYPLGGAMRINDTLYFILKDHLGSASAVTDAAGNLLGQTRYDPYGETRWTTGNMMTDKLFTGQRAIAALDIYHYQARFYSPSLGRFLSADTIVPSYANPQSLNRYAYVYNSPVNYTDPTGHDPWWCEGRDNEAACTAGWVKAQKKVTNTRLAPLMPKSKKDDALSHSGNGTGGSEGGNGTGNSGCRQDDDLCWLKNRDADNSQPTIPINPIQTPQIPAPPPGSESSSTGETVNISNSAPEMCSTNGDACIVGGALLIIFTDLFVGLPAIAVIILSGGVTPPAMAAEALETFVVLPINIFGIYLITQGIKANHNNEGEQ